MVLLIKLLNLNNWLFIFIDAETIECMADCGAVDLTTDAEFYSCISGKDLENLTDMSDFVSAYEDCEVLF